MPQPSREPPLDRDRLEQRLHDAAVMSGRLAHSFDNVLTGILGFAELTLTQMSPESAPYQYISEVLRAAQLGVQLTQQLHVFSRCGTGGPGPTDLSLVVAEEENRLAASSDARTGLRVELPVDLPAVAIDPESLRQLLAPLLDNARESMSAAGTIALTARVLDLDAAACDTLWGKPTAGTHVELSIADNGGGLAADARRRLFKEAFYTTKPRHRGLGLVVVYRILQARNGGFCLEAGTPAGTVARVYLPVSSAGPAASHTLSPRNS